MSCKNCKYTDEFCTSGDCPNDNAPDYENDLVFKPALSWEDLCEWVKEKHDDAVVMKTPEMINMKFVQFYKSGEIVHDFAILAKKRSYEQMKNIIDNLWSE